MMGRKLRSAVFLLLLGALVVVLVLSTHGLPGFLTRRIIQRMQISGMALSLDRIKIGVFEGVIAAQVRYYKKGDIRDPLFEAERLVLQFNPLDWFKGYSGLTGALIKNGKVRVFLDSSSGAHPGGRPQRLLFDSVRARLVFTHQHQLEVKNFSARLLNINLSGRGRVLLPAESPAPARETRPTGELGNLNQLATDILRWSDQIKLGNVLNLDVNFVIDPFDINNLDLALRLDSRNTRVNQSSVGAWCVTVHLKGKTGDGTVEIHSSSVEGIWLEKAAGRFRFDNNGLTLESLEAQVGRGAEQGPFRLSLNCDWSARQYRGQFTSGFDPHALIPLLKAMDWPPVEVIESFNFRERPPFGVGEFRGQWGSNWYCDVQGHGDDENLLYQGVDVSLFRSGFQVNVSATNGWVNLQPFLIVRGEGTVQGRILIDFDRSRVEFDAVSTAEPKPAAKMVDPFVAAIVAPYRFDGPVKVVGWGTAGFSNSAYNNMDLSVIGQGGGYGRFLADYYVLNVRVLDDTAEITDFTGGIYEGRFNAAASVNPEAAAPHLWYQVQAGVSNVNFELLMEALTGKRSEVYQGRLNATVVLQGRADDASLQTLTGAGQITIANGRIFQIPLFGGLTDLLAKIIPGVGTLLRQTDAWAKVHIGGGKVHADSIQIEGDILSLSARGDYYFNGQLDYRVQVRFLRKQTVLGMVLQLVTLPVTKILEFRLTGTVDHPTWWPVYLPKDMFSFGG